MVPSGECKRLYSFDKTLRFGVAHLQGRGLTIFMAKLIPRHLVGGDDMENRRQMYFMPHDIPGFQYLCNRKGEHYSGYTDWDGLVPVLWGWPGQDPGNASVVQGNYVSMLIYHGRTHAALEAERREAAAAAGREQDRAIKDAAYEAAHFHKHIERKESYSDPLWGKEDTLKGLKNAGNDGFLKTLENDHSDSFEAESLRNAGF